MFWMILWGFRMVWPVRDVIFSGRRFLVLWCWCWGSGLIRYWGWHRWVCWWSALPGWLCQGHPIRELRWLQPVDGHWIFPVPELQLEILRRALHHFVRTIVPGSEWGAVSVPPDEYHGTTLEVLRNERGLRCAGPVVGCRLGPEFSHRLPKVLKEGSYGSLCLRWELELAREVELHTVHQFGWGSAHVRLVRCPDPKQDPRELLAPAGSG